MNSGDLIERIERATVASCSCLTKTPDWQYHEINCRYRLLQEAADQLRDHEAGFDLRWKADMRAINRWQAATGRTMTWPDHADLVMWLLERLEAAERSDTPAGMNKKTYSKTYIGDGVYADWDGFQIILTTENGISVTNRIVLEPPLYKFLVNYINQTTRPNQAAATTGSTGGDV